MLVLGWLRDIGLWLRSFEVDSAVRVVIQNANLYRHKEVTYEMLFSEVQELRGALDGEHEHFPVQELVQIAGICINLLRKETRQVLIAQGRAYHELVKYGLAIRVLRIDSLWLVLIVLLLLAAVILRLG